MKDLEAPIQIKPIGTIRSCFQHKFGTPRQGSLTPTSRATIELDKQWIGPGSFDGLKGFSHLWIVSWLHHFNHDRVHLKTKAHPPRLEGEKRGVFATRSPHHPNPIGLTLARLEEVHEYHLVVSGMDLIEGTPVMDLKPYLPSADRPEEFTSGWLAQVPNKVWPVKFGTEALMQIKTMCETHIISVPAEEFKTLVTEVIKEDPRPLSYREKNLGPYAMILYEANVTFDFLDDHFLVTACEEKDSAIKAKPMGPIPKA